MKTEHSTTNPYKTGFLYSGGVVIDTIIVFCILKRSSEDKNSASYPTLTETKFIIVRVVTIMRPVTRSATCGRIYAISICRYLRQFQREIVSGFLCQ